MQLAEQLRRAGLFVFPCWVRYDESKQKWIKGPKVPKGESWKIAALRPPTDPQLNWSSGVLGLPIPDNVLVLDMDIYKGATREAVEQWLGCKLDWDRALIQKTIGGGEHYAFYCPWPARQIQDDPSVPVGVDTRAAGKGFICIGNGYTPHGPGAFRLAVPQSLPPIPEQAQAVLAPVERTAPRYEEPTTTAPKLNELSDLEAALRYIDPAGESQAPRASWLRTLMALKDYFRDDPDKGLEIAEKWSAGEYWGEVPHNYVSSGMNSVQGQWDSISADGGVHSATLFYKAIQGGWTPPATFDTSIAFQGPAAPASVFNDLLAEVRESGGAVERTADLIEEIKSSGCNPLQVALLASELKTALRDAGIKDKQVEKQVDAVLAPMAPSGPANDGLYGKNDADNAILFLSKYYPNGILVRCDGEFYKFNGKAWERLSADMLKGHIYSEMAANRMGESKASACFRYVSNVLPVYDGMLSKTDDTVILFDNGILDLKTGALHPHDQTLFTTNILPYSWDPKASCPQFLAFLMDAVSGDQDRVDLLQEWFGYLMTRRYDHQKIMVLLGGPRCGKGTIGRLLKLLLGEQNFAGGSLSSLASDAYLAAIRNKTAVFIGDAQKKLAPAIVHRVTEYLKAISGGDEITFDRKWLSSVSEPLPCRFTISANNIPSLFDDSGALASRMMVVPFDKSYLGREDLELYARLSAEITGIAAWSLQGLRRLAHNGKFTEPQSSKDELEAIQETFSPLLQFLSEACTHEPSDHCTVQELYDAYRAWCLREQEDLLKPKTFTAAIKDATRGRGVKYYKKVTRGFTGIAPRPAEPVTAAAFKVVK